MKQPKKPTLYQKKVMRNNGLDWKEWMVTGEDDYLHLVNKKTNERKDICLWK